MPATCTICTSPARHEIERRLVGGESMRAIAGQLGVSRSALARHRSSGHVPVAIGTVHRLEVEQHEFDLEQKALDLYQRAEAVLRRVEGQTVLELQAIRELRGVVETLHKLTAPPAPMRDNVPMEVHVRFANDLPTEPPKVVAALPSEES